MDNMEFAQRLKTLREQTGLSLRRAARESQISYKSIYRWESGESLPQVATLMIYLMWLRSRNAPVSLLEYDLMDTLKKLREERRTND